MHYAHVRNSDDKILEERDYPSDFDPADISQKFGPDKAVRVIPIVYLPKPEFDEMTQELVRNEVIELTRVVRSKVVQALPADDIEKKDLTDKLVKLKPSLKAGTATNEQVQKALWVIIDDNY